MPDKPTYLYIRSLSAANTRAFLCFGHLRFSCLIGKNGRTFFKREGDGKSPMGKWKLEKIYYRADVMRHQIGGSTIKKKDGWCDDKKHSAYNHKVNLPFAASHETLWREDNAYDLVITTNHNQRPRVKGLGSAIFLHMIREGATGTEGCIALHKSDWQKLIKLIGNNTYVVI